MLFWLLSFAAPVFGQTPIDSTADSSFVTAQRAGGKLGLGAAIGAPAGFAAKLWLENWSAFQMSIGGDLGEHRSLALTADYVTAFHPIESPDPAFEVPLYVGAGIKVDGDFQQEDSIAIGPRGVFGISVVVTEMPMDLYVEIAPTFYLFDMATFAPSWSMDGYIGAHYYF